jgi:hypothetical protein
MFVVLPKKIIMSLIYFAVVLPRLRAMYSLRESATRSLRDGAADGHVELSGSGHVPKAMESGNARGKRDLDDGAVEELLFGWFEGRNREGRKNKDLINEFNPLFPLFLILTNYLYLDILLIQSLSIKLILFPGFHTSLLVQRLTTPLGPDLCVKINTSPAQVTCALDPFIPCEYMIG